MSGLRSAAWKERLEAMEALQARVQELTDSLDASMLIQVPHAGQQPLPRGLPASLHACNSEM